MTRSSRWLPLVATTGAAAVLTGAAVLTVEGAGCDDPGSWVVRAGSVELVGGCLDREDLPVAPPPVPDPQPAPAVPLGD